MSYLDSIPDFNQALDCDLLTLIKAVIKLLTQLSVPLNYHYYIHYFPFVVAVVAVVVAVVAPAPAPAFVVVLLLTQKNGFIRNWQGSILALLIIDTDQSI